MSDKRIYRVTFMNQGEVYELYARSVGQGGMFGFIEIADFVFGERSSVVVDPSEEKLKDEFEGVKSCHVPMHAVLRIDEVSKEGQPKITHPEGGGSGNVMPFPVYTQKKD